LYFYFALERIKVDKLARLLIHDMSKSKLVYIHLVICRAQFLNFVWSVLIIEKVLNSILILKSKND